MLDIPTPRLSAAEWQDVRLAMAAVADCGCGTPAPAGSLRHGFGRAVGAIKGQRFEPAAEIPANLRPVRDFLCETTRTRHIARRHIPALTAQGFSRAQIEAMALLGV